MESAVGGLSAGIGTGGRPRGALIRIGVATGSAHPRAGDCALARQMPFAAISIDRASDKTHKYNFAVFIFTLFTNQFTPRNERTFSAHGSPSSGVILSEITPQGL